MPKMYLEHVVGFGRHYMHGYLIEKLYWPQRGLWKVGKPRDKNNLAKTDMVGVTRTFDRFYLAVCDAYEREQEDIKKDLLKKETSKQLWDAALGLMRLNSLIGEEQAWTIIQYDPLRDPEMTKSMFLETLKSKQKGNKDAPPTETGRLDSGPNAGH